MMHPHERAEIPSLGSTACVHVNPIDGYQCSNELRAQLNLTNDHQKKEKPHLKHVLTPPHGHLTKSAVNQIAKTVHWIGTCYRSSEEGPKSTEKLKPHGGQLFNQTTATG